MTIRRIISVVALCGCSVAAAQNGEVLEARDYRCGTLQQRAQQQGSVTLKIQFGALTVHGSPDACDTESDILTQPGWRTADKRFCIVGTVCTRKTIRLDD